MRICTELECSNEHYARGWCYKHYTQWYRLGYIPERTTRTPNEFVLESDHCKIMCYDKEGAFTGFAIIDLDDVDKCRPHKWHFHNGYVEYGNNNPDKLHHKILGVVSKKEVQVDHINGKKWDCRKCNLRLCSHAENMRNKGVISTNTTGYKGVFRDTIGWYSKIVFNGESYFLGYFETPFKAAIAYNGKALELHGPFARLNNMIRRRT